MWHYSGYSIDKLADCVLHSSTQLTGCLFVNWSCSSGRYSTAQDVLSELAEDHPLSGIVLKYRKLNTLHGHLLSRLQHAVDVDGDVTAWPAGDGLTRISGEWMQTNSSSGRLSMGDFSLQCIPKAVEYEIESTQAPAGGQRATRQAQSNIRAGFVAPPGHVLLAADYNQIELRLMAHFSGEQALLDALRQGDPLRAMAANWLHKPATEVGHVAVMVRRLLSKLPSRVYLAQQPVPCKADACCFHDMTGACQCLCAAMYVFT